MRQLNESAIMELLHERGPMTRPQLASLLGLSSATVTRIVRKLIHENLVFEKQLVDSTGGRRAALLEFNRHASCVVGLDLSGSNMLSALLDLDGEPLFRHTTPLSSGEDAINELMAEIETILVRGRAERPCGIVIGVPGITRSETGTVTWSERLRWRELPLQRMVQERFKIQTFIENNANLAALGEHWRGAGRTARNLVCISIGPGIGAGIIIQGELYRGEQDAAGEVGYLVIGEDGLVRTPDQMGCFESKVGEEAIVAQTRAAFAECGLSSLGNWSEASGEPLTPEIVADAAAQKDPIAAAVVDRAARYYAMAVANAACLLGPSLIILRGWIEHSDLINLVARYVHRTAPTVPRIEPSALKNDAVVIGGVALALRATRHCLAREAFSQTPPRIDSAAFRLSGDRR